MAEGQGNGSDSPERDGAWQSAPGTGEPSEESMPGANSAGANAAGASAAGASTPEESASSMGTPGVGAPGMTTPGASGTEAIPGATTPGTSGTGTTPGASTPGTSGPGTTPGASTPGTSGTGTTPGATTPGEAGPASGAEAQPPGVPGSPWQAQPGTQPTWAAPAAGQQPWILPGQPEPSGQSPHGTQSFYGDQPGTPPPHAGQHGTQPPPGPQPSYGNQPGGQAPYGAQPSAQGPYGGQPGAQPPYGSQPGTPSYGSEPGTQPSPASQPGPQPSYGNQPGGQPSYGAQPSYHGEPGGQAPHGGEPGSQSYSGQPPYGGQPGGQAPYGGQAGAQPPYGSQPPYSGQPGAQPPYGGPAGTQPFFGGQPGTPGPYGSQPPYPTQPLYGDQPHPGWQPSPGAPGAAPPLPGQLPSALPPGAQWAPPGGGYGQPPPAPPSRGPLSRALVYVLVAVLAAALGAGAVLALRSQPTGSSAAPPVSPQDVPKPRNNAPASNTPTSGINAQAVAGKVQPGLVDITSFVHFQRQVFEGTGMVLSSNGLVLTNNHVIKGSTQVSVRLVTGGRKYTAEVVGTDNSQDVALLRLKGAVGLKPIQVGNSDKVTVGTPVVALGNAGGTGGLPSVTTGTITQLHRKITASDAGSGTSEVLTNMFQTDAPIQEGDSGGALANAAGQVIAMNTAANSQGLGQTGPSQSQGFSIPINRALAIAHQIAAGHATGGIKLGQPAFLGIEIASNPQNTALASNAASPRQQLRQLQQIAQSNFGGVNSSGRCLADGTANPVPNSIAPAKSGTLIAGVFCGAPAVLAGAQAGDVITAVNGHSVSSPASLRSVMNQYRPGTTVSMTWISTSGQQKTGSLKLVAGPAA